jgi:putative transposase
VVGVEPICPVLTDHDCKIAPSTYYAHHRRQAAPAARTVRDAEPKILITLAYEVNYRVYGARKTWRHLNRQDVAVARRAVERLMRELGITGAVRGKKGDHHRPRSSTPITRGTPCGQRDAQQGTQSRMTRDARREYRRQTCPRPAR